MPTTSHPSGRTLRRPGASAVVVALDADVLTSDELEPAGERGVELPAEASLP